MSRRGGKVVDAAFGALFVLALAGVAWLAVRGWSYYSTPLIERPRHEDYWLLKPGGSWGKLYGVAGTALMLLMLSYPLRKRTGLFGKLGTLRSWLVFHIFCGIVGPLLIVLHTSLKFKGLVAISFWSMVVVALSGVLGRYLYRQIPRARSGDELSLAEARRAEEELGARLAELGVPAAALARLDELARAGPDPAGGALALLLRLPFADLRLRWRLAELRRELAAVPAPLRRRAKRLARRKARLARRIVLWSRLQALFHYWHVLHKPFAVVMYLFMAVHIAVVTLAGYGLGSW